MKKLIKSLFVPLLLSFSFLILIPITAGTDSATAQCNTNTSICTAGTAGPFNFVNPGPVVSTCLDFFGPNMGYIILHITSSGPLNMLIDGNSSGGFLDVAVFNIPNGQAPCTAIQNLGNQIGCNYASSASGCNQFGTSFPCSSSVPAPMVTAGQEIMILVENWSGSSSSFTMSLGPTGAQTGLPNPAINAAGPFCITSGPTQLTAADMGGTWSGPGVSASGLFNPAAAGLGTHTINYSVGVAPCNATSSTTVTVNSATVTPPATQTICSGGSATLTASGAGTYTWSPPTGLSSTSGATVAASPTSTTTYTVTGTTSGCTSNGTVTVTVAPLTVSVSPNTSICSGASTTLTASGGATSYTWSPATGLSSTTGASVTANPTTTTTYTVTGTNGSCSATANVTVTVTPVSVGLSPGTSICNGASTTLTASGATTYSWSPPAGLSASTGASVSASPTTTTTYTVTGTTGACSATNTVTVTVTPLALTVSPNANICTGASTILTAGGATNYTWSPPAGLSSTTGASVTATPATTTTYTVSGTTGSCSSSQTVTITVTPVIVNVTPNTSICNGSSTTLSASGGATNYSWSPAIGLSSTSGASVNANPTTTTTYTVTGTTGSCSNTATMTLTVNPIPMVTASNNGPLCEGSTMQLQASSLPGTTYNWTGPNGFTATTQNCSAPATLAASGTYTVTTSLNGCTSFATTDVIVNSVQIPVITQAGPFCIAAANSTFSADIPGGTWSGPGITDSLTGVFSPLLAGPGSHQITYTVSGGCSNPGTSLIQVNAMPVVQITTPESSGCVPFTAQLIDASSPTGTITWNFGDGSAESNQPGSVNHQFTSPGCYDVTVTSTSLEGCSTTLSFPGFICALPNAVASFSVNDPVHGLMYPEFQTFNTSSNASGYSWDFGDGGTSNLFNPNHTYAENAGSYEITLIANNPSNCPDTAKLTVTIQEELVFYVPNTFTPDGDEFNNVFLPIFTSGFDPFNYALTIYNRWGETLFESLDPTQGWDGTYAGELCKNGVYTWTIRFKSSGNDKKNTKTGHIQLLR